MWSEHAWFIVLSVALRILMMLRYVLSAEHLYIPERLQLGDTSVADLKKNVLGFREVARSWP